jgi:hypothetical protein
LCTSAARNTTFSHMNRTPSTCAAFGGTLGSTDPRRPPQTLHEVAPGWMRREVLVRRLEWYGEAAVSLGCYGVRQPRRLRRCRAGGTGGPSAALCT